MIVSLFPNELNKALECASQFFIESRLPGTLNFEHWKLEWTNLINSGIGEIFAYISEDTASGELKGILGVMYFPCSMTGELEALEGFWFMMPSDRGGVGAIRLLKRFEEEAKNRGCKRIKMVHLMEVNPEQVSSLYDRMGYKKLQVTYVKEI